MGRFRETVNNCENGSVTLRWRQSGDKIQRDVGPRIYILGSGVTGKRKVEAIEE